ncbi:hypothetical protein F5883DRAFT_565052 [Diaporthe sp. PMI_573]|nr:hypothetical protein F5883DRAFT_565052 [Diaporthaceae sp. PMI_573]
MNIKPERSRIEAMSSPELLRKERGLTYRQAEGGSFADANVHNLDADLARPTGSSSPASPTDDADDYHTASFCSTTPSLPAEEDGHGDACGRDDEIAARESKAAAVSLPSSIRAALQQFERLRHPRRRVRGATEDAEVVEIDITAQEYQLLWWLLGQEKEHGYDPLVRGVFEDQNAHRRFSVSSYLQLLQQDLLTIESVEDLYDLGSWALDSVRYDFIHVYDDSKQIHTRLCIRMPSIIHDRTAHYAGILFKESIEAKTGEDVDALNGTKCKFTDTFYQMIEKEKEEASTASQTSAPRTRSQTRPLQRPVHAARHEGSSSSGNNERREERAEYEAVHPDACIYTNDEPNMPVIIIEVGFSHPLPFDRARSYIYGSEGKCRIVVCLDIEYKDPEVRQQIYERLLSGPQPQDYQNRLPPYGITLNLFRCHPTASGEEITFVAKHDLRNLDVREAARQGKTLELRLSELADPVDDEDSAYDGEGADLMAIPYTEVVRLVDKAAWIHAIDEQPLLRPTTRKRWRAEMPSTSPEPGPDDSHHSRRKRVKR